MEWIDFIKEVIWDVLVNHIGASVLLPNRVRAMLYRWLGIRTMTNDIRPGCNFRGSNIEIGRGSFLNHSCVVEDHVKIGDNCMIAFDVILCTSTHKIGSHAKRGGESVNLPITIGNGCWIGARVTVLPGITVGDGCIIAAGAVVTSDCEPDGLYAGVPARRIKELSKADDRGLYAI